MLQDSDTNVYEDKNIHMEQTVEFNIRGKKQKVLSKKEKAKQDAKLRLNIRREQIKKENEKKKVIDAAPVSVMDAKGHNVIKNTVNEFEFIGQQTADVDLGLDSDLSGDDSDGDFDEYNKRVKQ